MFFIGGVIDLAHARIEAADDARRLRRFGQRLQRDHAGHRQLEPEGDALRHAAGDTHAGKRTGAGAEGDAIEIRAQHTLRRQQRINHRQQHLGIALTGIRLARVDAAVAPQRGRARFGR